MVKVRRLGHATLSDAGYRRNRPTITAAFSASASSSAARIASFSPASSRAGGDRAGAGQARRAERPVVSDRAGHDLDDVVKELQKHGVKCERRKGISPGVAEAVTFDDPEGHAGRSVSPNINSPSAMTRPSTFNILKLGHVAYRVLDVQKVVKFYSDVLGFRVSDSRGDYFVFMRCNTDHHTLNFIVDEKPQLHHIAFEVLDWAEIHKAADFLARNKIHLVWGPGRHVIGHNVATYHRNTDLVRVEIFTEMDQMKDEALGYFDPRPWHQERPLYPKMHGPETLRNYWGYGSERVIQATRPTKSRPTSRSTRRIRPEGLPDTLFGGRERLLTDQLTPEAWAIRVRSAHKCDCRFPRRHRQIVCVAAATPHCVARAAPSSPVYRPWYRAPRTRSVQPRRGSWRG